MNGLTVTKVAGKTVTLQAKELIDDSFKVGDQVLVRHDDIVQAVRDRLEPESVWPGIMADGAALYDRKGRKVAIITTANRQIEEMQGDERQVVPGLASLIITARAITG